MLLLNSRYQIEATEFPTYVIFKTLDDIHDEFPDFDKVQNIRKKREWYSRADWLSSAPQASLEFYNPLVMSKLRLTRDASRWNPFHTDAFLWIDGAHNCNDPVGA